MKIIVVGGTGTIGKAVVAELSKRHTIVVAGYSHGDVKVDIKDIKSIESMYQSVGKFDAVVSTAGKVHFGDFKEMTPENYLVGLNDKLMGQVNLVLAGLKYINEGGSFTLTSGILSRDPIRYGSSASMVNGAIDSFVIASAIEMPRMLRINSISPTIVSESMSAYGDYFHGFEPAPAARVAIAYSKSVEGAQTGQIYQVW
jgi:NAD(P)-dependent dehydrogenase (short-subunit alcohol dehydrogenase family)